MSDFKINGIDTAYTNAGHFSGIGSGQIKSKTADYFSKLLLWDFAELLILIFLFHIRSLSDDGIYYADAVGWAAEQGVVEGTSSSSFKPDPNREDRELFEKESKYF